MTHAVGGVSLGVLASALYATAVVVQAHEVRQTHPDHALRLSLLARLVRRPLWVTGAGIGLLGWLTQALALSVAPLTLIEPVLGITLVLMLALAALTLGETVSRRETIAAVAVVAGACGLTAVAPDHTTGHDRSAVLALVLAGLLVVVALPRLLHAGRRRVTPLLSISAGFAYATVALATKFLTDDAATHDWQRSFGWVAIIAVVAVAGLLSEMSALQQQPVTRVAPAVFGLNIALPVALAPLVGGETWNVASTSGATLLVLLGIVWTGAIVLARGPVAGSLFS